MKRLKTVLAALLGVVSIAYSGTAQGFPVDTAHYHGGPVLSPNITCLLWTPSSNPYTATDIQGIQDYVTGFQRYLTNAATPPGSNGAGTEPVPRQFGVWGAYFNGTCQADTHAPNGGVVNTGSIEAEVNTALGSTAYAANNLVLVFTKGWTLDIPSAQHWTIGPGQYLAVVPTDLQTPDISGHEIIEAATDPAFNSWFTDQGQSPVQPCIIGNEVCDGGAGTAGVTLQTPLSDGFGNPSKSFVVSDSVDNIDGNSTVTACGSSFCSAVGNVNQCSQSASGVQVVYSGNAFTNVTTTWPATVVKTGSKINVLTRTPSGIAHLVSTDNGATYTTVTAPVGSITELPAAYSKNGTTIDMYGRGLDGFLYHWVFNGSSWGAPVGLGKYLLGPPAAAAVQMNGSPADVVWVTSNDLRMYIWINGSWFYANMPANVLAMSPPQVFQRNGTIDIYFTGMDGNMYVDPAWTGTWQQLPGDGYGLMHAVGHPSNQNRADVFMKLPVDQGGSSTLWAQYQSGALVSSTLLSGIPIGTGPTSAVKVGTAPAMWLFFTKANQMYRAPSNSAGTSFPSAVQVSAAPTITSPITAFTPDNNIVMAYARRQSNGHLIQLRYVGNTAPTMTDLGVAIM